MVPPHRIQTNPGSLHDQATGAVANTLRDALKVPVGRGYGPVASAHEDSAPHIRTERRASDDQNVDAALLRLQELFFVSCVDYPSDEQLQQRMRSHCSEIEGTLQRGEMRHWRSGRDCLLARLGFRLLSA